MINSYRWCDKLHDYAIHAGSILAQNNLKRNHINSYPKNRPRPRILANGYNVTPTQIDNVILPSLQRLFGDLTIEVSRPFGNPTVLKLTLARTLKAVILLRGLLVEWVMVKGFNESFEDERSPEYKHIRRGYEHREEKLDIWSESRYEVFRKVTEHANAAMLHFYSPVHPDIAIKSFIVSSQFNNYCVSVTSLILQTFPN